MVGEEGPNPGRQRVPAGGGHGLWALQPVVEI